MRQAILHRVSVVKNEPSNQAHAHLSQGLTHHVRVIPKGRGRLHDCELRIPLRIIGNYLVWAAIHRRRNVHPMPVNSCCFTDVIGNVDQNLFPLTGAQRGAKIAAVDPECVSCQASQKVGLSLLQAEIEYFRPVLKLWREQRWNWKRAGSECIGSYALCCPCRSCGGTCFSCEA